MAKSLKPNEKDRGGEAKKQLVGLRRGIEALRLLSNRDGGMSFGALQNGTGLQAPTLSRLLKVLLDMELIDKHPQSGRYSIGDQMFSLARSILGTVPREALIQPILDTLAERTRASAAYFELEGTHITLKAKAEHAQSFHYMPVSQQNTQFPHGFLQACFAFLEREDLERFLKNMDRAGFITKAEWKKRMERVRRRHIYVDDGDSSPGAIRVCAPVFAGTDGSILGSIGITALKGRLVPGELATHKQSVKSAAGRAIEALTHPGPAGSKEDQ